MGRTAKVLGAAIAFAVALLGVTLPAAAQPTAAQASPLRTRATWIGAVGVDSLNGWKHMNQEVGPSQTAREYYTGALPSSWTSDASNFCAKLPSVQCVISYTTMENGNVLSAFVRSIPKVRKAPVFIVYDDEPETKIHNISAKEFIKNYENQVDVIRGACKQKGNCRVVKVAMIAATYQYQPKEKGAGCSYIPQATYVDAYFADVYEPTLDGLPNNSGFQGWNNCTKGRGVVRGLTEYGLGVCIVKPETGQTSATPAEREMRLAGDARYLSKAFPDLYEWEYYWHQGASAGGCHEFQFPVGSPVASEWRAIEHGTVSS